MRPEDLVARPGGDEFAVLIEERFERDKRSQKSPSASWRPCKLPLTSPATRSTPVPASGSPRIGVGRRTPTDPQTSGHGDVRRQGQRSGPSPSSPTGWTSRPTPGGDRVRPPSRIGAGSDPLSCTSRLSRCDAGYNAVKALVRWQHPTCGLPLARRLPRRRRGTGLIIPIGRLVLRESLPPVGAVRAPVSGRHQDQLEPVRHAAARSQHRRRCSLRVEAPTSTVEPSSSKSPKASSSPTSPGRPPHARVLAFPRGQHRYRRLRDRLLVVLAPSALPSRHHQGRQVLCRWSLRRQGGGRAYRAVLAIGKEFCLEVVAEGFESLNQDAELGSLGCKFGQGYFYASPGTGQKL